MRGRLLGLLLVSIPLQAASAEPPGLQASEAIALIDNARQNRAQGYLYRAEAQYRRALAIVEQTSGAQSPDLTPALNGLAELYFEARRYTEAEALARRSAAVVEASLGGRPSAIGDGSTGSGRHLPRAGTIRQGAAALLSGAGHSRGGSGSESSVSRNFRTSPVGRRMGSAPRRVNSSRQPRSSGSGPDTVPLANRSPGCRLQPLLA
jgi:hypothetical protein